MKIGFGYSIWLKDLYLVWHWLRFLISCLCQRSMYRKSKVLKVFQYMYKIIAHLLVGCFGLQSSTCIIKLFLKYVWLNSYERTHESAFFDSQTEILVHDFVVGSRLFYPLNYSLKWQIKSNKPRIFINILHIAPKYSPNSFIDKSKYFNYVA